MFAYGSVWHSIKQFTSKSVECELVKKLMMLFCSLLISGCFLDISRHVFSNISYVMLNILLVDAIHIVTFKFMIITRMVILIRINYVASNNF